MAPRCGKGAPCVKGKCESVASTHGSALHFDRSCVCFPGWDGKSCDSHVKDSASARVIESQAAKDAASAIAHSEQDAAEVHKLLRAEQSLRVQYKAALSRERFAEKQSASATSKLEAIQKELQSEKKLVANEQHDKQSADEEIKKLKAAEKKVLQNSEARLASRFKTVEAEQRKVYGEFGDAQHKITKLTEQYEAKSKKLEEELAAAKRGAKRGAKQALAPVSEHLKHLLILEKAQQRKSAGLKKDLAVANTKFQRLIKSKKAMLQQDTAEKKKLQVVQTKNSAMVKQVQALRASKAALSAEVRHQRLGLDKAAALIARDHEEKRTIDTLRRANRTASARVGALLQAQALEVKRAARLGFEARHAKSELLAATRAASSSSVSSAAMAKHERAVEAQLEGVRMQQARTIQRLRARVNATERASASSAASSTRLQRLQKLVRQEDAELERFRRDDNKELERARNETKQVHRLEGYEQRAAREAAAEQVLQAKLARARNASAAEARRVRTLQPLQAQEAKLEAQDARLSAKLRASHELRAHAAAEAHELALMKNFSQQQASTIAAVEHRERVKVQALQQQLRAAQKKEQQQAQEKEQKQAHRARAKVEHGARDMASLKHVLLQQEALLNRTLLMRPFFKQILALQHRAHESPSPQVEGALRYHRAYSVHRSIMTHSRGSSARSSGLSSGLSDGLSSSVRSNGLRSGVSSATSSGSVRSSSRSISSTSSLGRSMNGIGSVSSGAGGTGMADMGMGAAVWGGGLLLSGLALLLLLALLRLGKGALDAALEAAAGQGRQRQGRQGRGGGGRYSRLGSGKDSDMDSEGENERMLGAMGHGAMAGRAGGRSQGLIGFVPGACIEGIESDSEWDREQAYQCRSRASTSTRATAEPAMDNGSFAQQHTRHKAPKPPPAEPPIACTPTIADVPGFDDNFEC